MIHVNLFALDYFNRKKYLSIESTEFVDEVGEFQTLWLSNFEELDMLFSMLGFDYEISPMEKQDSFIGLIDLSKNHYPEFDDNSFRKFYDSWIFNSHRDNTIDEYGQLLFLLGKAKSWNNRRFRIALIEKQD